MYRSKSWVRKKRYNRPDSSEKCQIVDDVKTIELKCTRRYYKAIHRAIWSKIIAYSTITGCCHCTFPTFKRDWLFSPLALNLGPTDHAKCYGYLLCYLRQNARQLPMAGCYHKKKVGGHAVFWNRGREKMTSTRRKRWWLFPDLSTYLCWNEVEHASYLLK